MMRATLLVLLLANAGYFAWTKGHLTALGGPGSWADPAPQSEPQRLALQLEPERLKVLVPASGAQTIAHSPPPDRPSEPTCLQTTALSDTQAEGLRGALASALPEGSWTMETAVEPARWVVYLGKFSSPEALRLRKSELRTAKVDHRDVNNPALQPGLALGTFPTENAATQALREAIRNGIKSAKVVIERPETRQHTLTLPRATPAQQETVRNLSGGLEGNPVLAWQACPG